MSAVPATITGRNSLEAFWLPFTANRAFKAAPRLVVDAKGMYYQGEDGRQLLDTMAGLWCVNAGHGQKPIADAIKAQADGLDYASSFMISHPSAFELAERIVALAPEGIDHIFFVNSGSEAVDTALKIARGYHRARGQSGRVKFIGRFKAYHGMGFGGLSVGGIERHKTDFGPLLPDVRHMSLPYDQQKSRFSKGQPEFGADYAEELVKLIEEEDPATIAAVIVEPVTGSAGVYPPPKGYLERLRQICTQHGILLIFDEVITGFGRLGTPFAATRFGVTPDLITCAKGMTNGAMPMGGVLTAGFVYEAFMERSQNQIELMHGYTYSAHPIACAAALATIEVYRDQDIFARAAAIAPIWQEAVHSLKDARHVLDIRNIGVLGSVELESRDGVVGPRGQALNNGCFKQGVLLRTTGDTVLLSPPLIISAAEIDRVVTTLRAVLQEIE